MAFFLPRSLGFDPLSSSMRFVVGSVALGQIILLLICLFPLHCHSTQAPFIHLSVCLKTGPKPLPKPDLHIVRSRTFSFRCEYSLLSLRPSNSFLNLIPGLPLTSIPHFAFPSITCRRRQFLRKMWPIQLAFRLLISCRILLCSLTLILLHYPCPILILISTLILPERQKSVWTCQMLFPKFVIVG
jgi:hypothetical protein